jgi:hypothetical protein
MLPTSIPHFTNSLTDKETNMYLPTYYFQGDKDDVVDMDEESKNTETEIDEEDDVDDDDEDDLIEDVESSDDKD